MNLKVNKKKTVKAWAIYHKRLDDLSEVVFETRKEAGDYLRMNSYHSNPLFMKKVLKNYKIIPIKITYEV